MNNYVEFDVDTITAADYTVCFELAETSYETFHVFHLLPILT